MTKPSTPSSTYLQGALLGGLLLFILYIFLVVVSENSPDQELFSLVFFLFGSWLQPLVLLPLAGVIGYGKGGAPYRKMAWGLAAVSVLLFFGSFLSFAIVL